MLLTFEEFPRNIKAGWKENLQTFMNERKNLEATGMTTMGSALKQVFDTLNINRMQTGIDMYGQGRYPFYLEPAVIIVISDGGKLTTQVRLFTQLFGLFTWPGEVPQVRAVAFCAGHLRRFPTSTAREEGTHSELILPVHWSLQ